MTSEEWRDGPVAVLASGGVDSAVLVGELAERSPRVAVLYARFGLVWENAEEAALRRYLAALGRPNVDPLVVFEAPVRTAYGEHWSTSGVNTPDEASDDAAVYLPGRNLLLLPWPAVWCYTNGIRTIALGTLSANPFPDASEEFFADFERLIERAIDSRVQIVCPYRRLNKELVVRRAKGLPLAETFSCIRPAGLLHCGQCNKCAERRRGFADAGIEDTTRYAAVTPIRQSARDDRA